MGKVVVTTKLHNKCDTKKCWIERNLKTMQKGFRGFVQQFHDKIIHWFIESLKLCVKFLFLFLMHLKLQYKLKFLYVFVNF